MKRYREKDLRSRYCSVVYFHVFFVGQRRGQANSAISLQTKSSISGPTVSGRRCIDAFLYSAKGSLDAYPAKSHVFSVVFHLFALTTDESSVGGPSWQFHLRAWEASGILPMRSAGRGCFDG